MIKSIGFISHTSGEILGGSEVSLNLLASHLATRGIKIYLASFASNTVEYDDSIEVVNCGGITPIELYAPPITLIFRVLNTMRYFEKIGVDITHIYNVGTLSGAGLYKLLGGRMPVIATLNNYSGVCPYQPVCKLENIRWMKCFQCYKNRKLLGIANSLVYPVVRYFMKNIDGYIALSGDVKRIYSLVGYDIDNIAVIPNLAEFEFNDIYITKKPVELFNVLYVGRLDKGKGVCSLIKAIKLMLKMSSSVRLTVIGDGPEMSSLQKLVKDLGIEGNINFIGYVPHLNIMEYYKMADVFVHPCLFPEPFGRTIIEAMSLGLPCIVSNMGAPPEIVSNAGLVYKAGDYRALYQKLKLLYDNPDLRFTLSKKCRAALARYKPDVIIGKILCFYEDIIKKSSIDSGY